MVGHHSEDNSYLIISREELENALLDRIEKGGEIIKKDCKTQKQLEKSRSDYFTWTDFNSELLKASFNNPKNEYRKQYSGTITIGVVNQTFSEEVQDFKEDVKSKIQRLKSILNKLPLIKVEEGVEGTFSINKSLHDVFIVHGHNNEAKEKTARLLQKLSLNPIILHEKPNEGQTIIEKFEKNSEVGFAIILLTFDDLGNSKKVDKLLPRARQNVILEMGYFIGKLGRHRVCSLYEPDVELPSDFNGVLYVEYDSGDS
jgi:predicted nucleotide-binding protein